MGEGRRGALPLDPAKSLPLEPLTVGTDPLWDDWDTPLQTPASPMFHLDGFEGPMDLLLDLAERQRIDLGQLSFADLAGQFVAECEGRLRGMPLERRADWLVMAARLLLLRSRLLFPADAAAAAEAGRDARAELARLGQAAHIRAAADWLAARPQLGVDVFARPRHGPDPRVASYMGLMEACLVVLRGHAWREEPVPVYRPPVRDLWRVQDALARIRSLMAERPEGGSLAVFLPPISKSPDFEVKARAAVASSFVAALELCRANEVRLEQVDQDVLVAARSN